MDENDDVLRVVTIVCLALKTSQRAQLIWRQWCQSRFCCILFVLTYICNEFVCDCVLENICVTYWLCKVSY